MVSTKIRILTIAVSIAIVLTAMPCLSMAQCTTCATPTVTYMPAYMPTPVYRALYQPTVVTAYRPWYGWSVPTGYAVTAYRPVFGWPRLVPYTTYRPVYTVTPVVTYSMYNPCASCCVPCDPCASGACGTATYAAPASSCPSCAPAVDASGSAAPQKTFQENVQKPAAEPELKPIPQAEPQLKPTGMPQLVDPNDRTAQRPTPYTARLELTAARQSVISGGNDDWHPARD